MSAESMDAPFSAGYITRWRDGPAWVKVVTVDAMRVLWVPAAAALVIAGCGGASEAPAREYQLQGQILAVRPERSEVVIKHQDIKGFMPGMTMPFKVKEGALLQGKEPGDLVTATLVVGEVMRICARSRRRDTRRSMLRRRRRRPTSVNRATR